LCHLSPDQVDALTIDDFENLTAGCDEWVRAQQSEG
jgi:hypothetical protein